MVRRPRVVTTTAAVLLSAVLVAACGDPRVGSDPPGGPPADARIPVHPAAAHLPPGTALPDDFQGTYTFVTRVAQPFRDRERVTWPQDAPAPATVPAYRLGDHLPGLDARADRLARTLGLDPALRTSAGGTLRYEDGGDAVLVVAVGAGQQWAFARDGADCQDVDGTETAALLARCARTRADRTGRAATGGAVTERVARRVARPVLAAAGSDVAATRMAHEDGAALLYVNPTVAGRSTHGLPTGVLVDQGGVRAATGWLGEAIPVATYGVRPLAELVAPDGVAVGGLRCASPTVAPECARSARARDVRLGYVPWRFEDGWHLVPTWLADDDEGRLLGALPAVTEDLLPTYFQQMYAPYGM